VTLRSAVSTHDISPSALNSPMRTNGSRYLDKRIDILEHYWHQSLDIRERLAALEERLKKR